MTNAELYNLLFNGGNYSRPFLIKFSHDNLEPIYLVNNNEPIVYEGNTYQVASFKYTPPNQDGTSGTLSISSLPNDNNVFEFVENTDSDYRLDIIGLISSNGTIQKIKQYSHFYGSVSVDEKANIEFNLGADDRLDMTFTPYKYDTDNNRGNA